MTSINTKDKLPQAPWSLFQTILGTIFVFSFVLLSGFLSTAVYALYRILTTSEFSINVNGFDTPEFTTLALFFQGIAVVGGVLIYLKLIKQKISSLQIKKPLKSDLLVAGGLFLFYLPVTSIVIAIAGTLFTGFNADQVQDLNLNIESSKFIVINYLLVVILAPINEEIMMRGFMYRGLRRISDQKKFKKIMNKIGAQKYINLSSDFFAILVTSALFGLLHGQWNVGIDTFVLSVFMIIGFKRTGNLLVPIIIHFLKNSLAFYFLINLK